VTGSAAESHAEFPLDLSASKAELGYTPQFPLKDALRDYMEDLWSEGVRG
jgi:nucleoside-diphosphate-sugar epimerase